MERTWLQDLLDKTKLSHREIARRANISNSYISHILSGRRRPSPEVAKRIAKALDIESEWYRLLE